VLPAWWDRIRYARVPEHVLVLEHRRDVGEMRFAEQLEADLRH
jgi:hypothetical protein